MEVLNKITHYWKYFTNSSYRRDEDEKNSSEWKRLHKNTLEGMEREYGLVKIIDLPYDPDREMGRWR